MHRFTLLGWSWPLVRQLAQLAVLVFVFGHVLDLGIEDYAIYVFIGLIFWTWFASGVGNASSSLLAQRHLVFRPRFPTVVLPAVSVAVPFIDVLLALPVLAVLLIATDEVHWTIVFLPVLLLVQFVLQCGIGWLTAAATVYVRDVRNIVAVALTLLFYLTPVFYTVERIPDKYRSLLLVNPVGTLVDAYRAVVLDRSLPPAWAIAILLGVSVGAAAGGALYFRRVEAGFVDEL